MLTLLIFLPFLTVVLVGHIALVIYEGNVSVCSETKTMHITWLCGCHVDFPDNSFVTEVGSLVCVCGEV